MQHLSNSPNPHARARFSALVVALCVLALAGCSSQDLETLDGPEAAAGAAHIVHPGQSIQAAVDAVGANGTVHVMPGVYQQTVTVTQPGVRIMGRPGPRGQRVIIENPGGAVHGINVRPGANNFALMHVTLRGFDRNGIFIFEVDGFDVRHVQAVDNGVYGIYPVFSRNGTISHCEASGHADAGIYIGQSERVRIAHSVTHGNVIGIEVSNATDILVTHNRTYGNTVGILAALLPGRSRVRIAEDIQIVHNTVYDNNLPNFAGTGLAAAVPQGSGILVLGLDRTVVEKNTVTGNDFIGIGLGSTLTLGAFAGLPPEAFADIEPNPDGVTIRKNHVTGNGASPPPLPLPGVDLLWDGTGTDNCWSQNTFGTSFPAVLPACGGGV
jgi:parallel beta-helix repeat protein